MTIAADLTFALETAPPIPTGFRRWVVVGISAGLALGGELASKGKFTPECPCGHWTTRVPPRLWGITIIPTDCFPGWTIVDRPRSALESVIAETA